MAIMPSFMLYLNMGLNLYLKAQKSSLDWWCHLHVDRYCWMKSTMLSCLLILGIKRWMLFFFLLCLVAPDARILLESFQRVLGLSIY